jgi:hypothetical protein
MSTTKLRQRIAALRADAAAIGTELAEHAPRMESGELFEVAGELQGAVNAAEGAQLVAIAHASSLEIRLTERGPVDVQHDVGFVDAMASSEVSLATGVGQWAAGRKVGLAAQLSSRFPRLLDLVAAGDLAPVNAGKVVTACDGLDDAACAAVEAVLADRLVGMDPARVTTVARRVATRIAADQVAAAQTRNRKDRLVQVTPGPDGSTDWWARLPAARSAAAWAAVRDLGDQYATQDPDLTLDQARADALMDLLLTNVTVNATVTLGIPVLTGPDADTAREAAAVIHAAESVGTDGVRPTIEPVQVHVGHAAAALAATGEDETATTGLRTAGADTPSTPVADGQNDSAADEHAHAKAENAPAGTDSCDPGWVRPAFATGGLGSGGGFSLSAALLSGCEIPGVGWVDAQTVETLLSVVPTDIGRALLDARTGTLMESVNNAYRPSKNVTDFVTTRDGTCRMWGCTRPSRRCDIDHARPWPNGPTTPANLGGLCRRHHRLKQRRRWTYRLDPDGTATWTSPTGTKRITHPDHATIPPPPPPKPTAASATPPRTAVLADDPPPF